MSVEDDSNGVSPLDSRNARIGLVFFLIYVIIYAVFVYLSAFRADLMATKPFAGVNLAIWYGLALIVIAIVMAIIYMFVCKTSSHEV